MSAFDRLLERLQTGWQPTPDEIDPEIEQHTLNGWYFLYRPLRVGEPRPLRFVGEIADDPDDLNATEMTGDILWMDAGQAWALCADGFYWLDGPEQPRLGHEDRRR
ncbi:MAG: hypothetical protein QOJ15_2390 [Bradyrhizobium sp.]|jgi:hypothetical protein|nr:hypothetical protein [Bradyrhizobium sp.]